MRTYFNLFLALTTSLCFAQTTTVSTGGSITIQPTSSWSTSDLSVSGGSVVINSDATNSGTLIATGIGSTSSGGTITYNRYLDDTDYHIISSPVEGQAVTAFVNNTDNTLATSGTLVGVGKYDNTNASGSRWEWYDTSSSFADTNFNTGEGYAIRRTSAGTLSFEGGYPTTETNEVKVTLSTDANGHFWYMVGNPYTAYMTATSTNESANTLLSYNVDLLDEAYAALYFYDGESWTPVNGTSDTYIAPGQAFAVRMVDKNPYVFRMPQSYQKHITQTDNFYKADELPKLTLYTTDGDRLAQTVVMYTDNGTEGLDPGHDAGTFESGQELTLDTKLIDPVGTQDPNFSIQVLSNMRYEEQVIPVAINAAADKEISFSYEATNIPSNLDVYLEDRLNKEFYNLSERSASFTFSAEETQNNRFFIHTSSVFPKDDSEGDYQDGPTDIAFDFHKLQDKTLYFEGIGNNEPLRIMIYNISGLKVLESTAPISTDNNEIKLPATLSQGVYIAIVQRKDGSITTKKIIIQ